MMRRWTGCAALLLMPCLVGAQATSRAAPATPPTLEEIRKGMGIPSIGTDLRGQQDVVGFASTAEQMARVWELSTLPPSPDLLGTAPAPGVAAVICPHDDYLYAGRVDRTILPLVTARTVVLVGVFHRYRWFGARDVLVFDPYRAWKAPDGEVPVSPLREEIISALPKDAYVRDAAMHDSEHSLEAVLYWLRHRRPDLEILPVIVPAASFDRMEWLGRQLGEALAGSMRKRGWTLGRDVAIVISSDAVHYGPDFKYVPYGEGGVEAYVEACKQDQAILTQSLAGRIDSTKVRDFFSQCVNPDRPDDYRLTWCGRFSIPLGLLVLESTARSLGEPVPMGHAVAYATSVGGPELPVREVGMGETAPANLYHFVGFPAAAYTVGR